MDGARFQTGSPRQFRPREASGHAIGSETLAKSGLRTLGQTRQAEGIAGGPVCDSPARNHHAAVLALHFAGAHPLFAVEHGMDALVRHTNGTSFKPKNVKMG